MTLEVGRRWVNGRWTTDIENETGGGGGSQPVQAAPTVPISAAEIVALGLDSNTYKTLVDAPGAGFANIPLYATLQYVAGDTPFSGTFVNKRLFIAPIAAWLDFSNPPWIVFSAADTLIFGGGTPTDYFVAQPAGTFSGVAVPTAGKGSPPSDFENTEIAFFFSGDIGDLGGGSGTLYATVLYWTVELAAQ